MKVYKMHILEFPAEQFLFFRPQYLAHSKGVKGILEQNQKSAIHLFQGIVLMRNNGHELAKRKDAVMK
ncbi:MAG: hypothetical protein ACKVPJ_11130 [Chitinophagales bacterium]